MVAIYMAGALLTLPIVSFALVGTGWPGVALVAASGALRLWHKHIYPQLPRRASEWAPHELGYIDVPYSLVPPPAQIPPPQVKRLEGGR